jgi:hypothetical protein
MGFVMSTRFLLVALGAPILASACHRSRTAAPQTAATRPEQSVFTDSAMHAQRCEPIKPDENWRVVCIPKDQRVDYGVRPKKP